MLNIDNLFFGYNAHRAVIQGFNLSLASGSVCGLLGPNGAGKSTLLYLIAGLLSPKSGSVTFDGFTPAERRPEFLRDIFIVGEESRLPGVTLDNFLRVNAPFYPRFDREAMEEYLRLFQLDPAIDLRKLSMGQSKKALLAFAFACNTRLLLLDEPTNGLDISSKRIFRQVLSKSMDDEKTVIISTHQVHDVEDVLDHVIITDLNSVLLNASLAEVQGRLRFGLTTDRGAAEAALMSVDVPGGYGVVRLAQGDGETDPETEVNLELLFELAQSHPETLLAIFR